jgi:asparagine synthase (glutamine-hydrolysing)
MGRMCGISGIIQKRDTSVDRSAIDKMVQALKHRGPDGEGVFEGPGFFLGHNRLAILDLSPLGYQPMELGSRGDRLVLTYNGEIYNYLEIREELRSLGHVFKSETDSEVLLHAYQEWGASCLDRFNGMFAFVIYDERKKLLFGARDRFGIKPLYLRNLGDTFTFASEIKALLTVRPSDGFEMQPIVDYLYAGHVGHTPQTFFKGITEHPAGHYFTYELSSHSLVEKRWYDLRERVGLASHSAPKTREEAAERLGSLLTESVRIRLRSDVRVGTCLSGGMDSSSIAMIASKLNGGGFFGITAQSLDPANDETEFARAVAEKAKLEWHCVKPEDFRDRLDAVVRSQDEPFTGLSVFMQDSVMAEARRLGVPVLLDGQGGDEIFLGYPKYLQALTRSPFSGGGSRMFSKRAASAVGWLEKREFESELELSAPKELEIAREHLLAYRRSLSNAREAQIMDITATNLPQLLRFEDRNSMRHSIEARLPFLDYRLVEFGVSLPTEFKIHDGVQKAVLREAMVDSLPIQITSRRDKVGFAAPDARWNLYFDALWSQPANPEIEQMVPGVRGSAAPELSPVMKWKLISLSHWARIASGPVVR